jgi:hypothetical protein
MQAIPPAGAQNPNGHSSAEILEAIQGKTGGRRWSFRYELLDSANVLVGDLTSVTACTVSQSWLADIKRSASFTIADTGEINYLSDRIKPWARLHVPPYGTDDWVEWPLGVFLLSSPARTVNEVGAIVRSVDAYDALQVFTDDKVTDRYAVTAGTVYTAAVSTLLGTISKNIVTSTSTLLVTKEWDPGTPKLAIINDLLAAINYESLSFDENGVAIVKPYASPSARTEEYVYADDETSLIVPAVEQALDLFGVPNKWVLVVSDPDRPALTSTYTNTAAASPTSTVRRGRTIVDFRTEEDAADQAALDAKVARLAFEASQVYESIAFTTGINPLHSGNDVYRLTYSGLAINAKYSEVDWSMPLEAGAAMTHTARRVVTV